MKKENIVEVEQRFNEWLRNLDIFEQELDLLKNHLGRIEKRASSGDLASQLAVYDARIQTQQQKINELRNRIEGNILELAERTEQDGAWYVENTLGQQYLQMQDAFLAEQKTLNNLREDFNAFSAAQT